MTTGLDYSEDYADDNSPVWNLGRAVGFLPMPPGYTPAGDVLRLSGFAGQGRRARRALRLQDAEHRRAGVGAAPRHRPDAERPAARADLLEARRRAGCLLPGRRHRRRIRRRRAAHGAAGSRALRRSDAPRRQVQRPADRAQGRSWTTSAAAATARSSLPPATRRCPAAAITACGGCCTTPHGAYSARGIHGQAIYVDPAAEMVIARFASHPLGGNVNMDPTSLPAYDAVANWLMKP